MTECQSPCSRHLGETPPSDPSYQFDCF